MLGARRQPDYSIDVTEGVRPEGITLCQLQGEHGGAEALDSSRSATLGTLASIATAPAEAMAAGRAGRATIARVIRE